MFFAPDTDEALTFDVALMNTVAGASPSGRDEIADPGQLAGFVDRFRFSGRVDGDAAELDAVRSVRTLLRSAWTLPPDEMVAFVNDVLATRDARPRLTRHDGTDWHLHATPEDAALADRIAVEAAMALVDVVRSGRTGRLRECAATDCDGRLVDLSKNGSRRFCSVRCSNRTNTAAHRARKATRAAGTEG
ncbi:CGNR zinc finger domain-containing protein [Curtobacterium oceanosedimentum]|uniref:CGNR zinc finger domain-containing protein n=1 Tax=Curtobacterium oceanosedimentum TaxID=465820 RepID=UPI001CE04CE7|nr:CGNR zinc finger domain-containing protein [Curtobacterium oceanosedimentum]MCA5924162.1 CGNR zinc finger domain-containing protein [Curtobacterium oceanosedimentum]